jgi:hypothetical protein
MPVIGHERTVSVAAKISKKQTFLAHVLGPPDHMELFPNLIRCQGVLRADLINIPVGTLHGRLCESSLRNKRRKRLPLVRQHAVEDFRGFRRTGVSGLMDLLGGVEGYLARL